MKDFLELCNWSMKQIDNQIRMEEPDLIIDKIKESHVINIMWGEEEVDIPEDDSRYPQFLELWEKYFSLLKLLAYEEKAKMTEEEWCLRWVCDPSEWDKYH